MAQLLNIIAYVINGLHDWISTAVKLLKFDVNDKELRFWVIGVTGIVIFLLADAFFKRIARWGISVVSFVYTLTVLVVIVFGLEIQQKITGRGVMEFKDVVYGLWGFIAIFSVYLFIRLVIYLFSKLISKKSQRRYEKQ